MPNLYVIQAHGYKFSRRHFPTQGTGADTEASKNSPPAYEQRFFFFNLFRATPIAYGSSQARGQIRAVAASLHHSHSNAGSEPHQQPTPQLTATPDPQPTK